MAESSASMSTFESSITIDDTFRGSNLNRKRIIKAFNGKPDEGFRFGISDFKILRKLGQGKFGDVFLAVHKETNMILALKRIEKAKVKKFNMLKQVIDEMKIHLVLNHPNIIKFFGVFDDHENVYLILESINTGTLFDRLNEKEKLPVSEAVQYITAVVKAIDYMHQKSIAHRDIKPENILVADCGIAKLCDLGWSAYMTSTRKTYCGTFDYVAPEIL